jgi:hypothetical protein
MAIISADRLLWTAVLVGLGVAYYSVPELLQQVKDAAKAPRSDAPPPAKRLQKDSENSLKIGTLRTLADGYSHELQTSAIKIIASRTVRSRTKRLLLRDLASKDYGRRDDAINGVWMLLYHPALNDIKMSDEFADRESFAAVTQALINVLPLHDINKDRQIDDTRTQRLPRSPIRPPHRPAHEVSLLIILNNQLRHINRRIGRERASPSAMEYALQAGLVTRWLTNYPFPCALPENSRYNFKHSDVARLFNREKWMIDDPLMADIIIEVMQYPLGRKQMLDAGLKGANYKENVNVDRDAWGWDQWPDEDVAMVGGEYTAGFSASVSRVRPRSTERSQEEEHLRRRHREAVVVAEPGVPLRRENILQREDSEAGLRPMRGVSSVEERLSELVEISNYPSSQQQGATPNHFVPARDMLQAAHERRYAAEIERETETREIERLLAAQTEGRVTLEAPDVDSGATDGGNGESSNAEGGEDE